MLGNVEVLRIVEVRVESILDSVDNSWFQVDQKSPRDVVLVVCLVEEHILPVISVPCIVFKDTFRVNSMFLTQVLPEFVSN
jgi:hypothetical protein